jgi:hypothetical protein
MVKVPTENKTILVGLIIGIIIGAGGGYAALSPRSTSLENQVNSLQTQVDNLQNEANKVPSLQQQLTNSQEQVNQLETQITSLDGDKTLLQTQIGNLSELVSKQELDISSLQSSLLGRVSRLPGYDVGVDYHAYGSDFQHTAFITIYHRPEVRQEVRRQLQGMADRGATVICTNIWFVTEPGTSDFGETWRSTFPMSDQEQANLRAYTQDVAAVVGSGGDRLRLEIALRWLGAADYLQGSPTTGIGSTPITATEFTARVESTTDNVLAAVSNVARPDGVSVVNTIYLDGEIMVGAKANQEWFLVTHYPRFVSRVSQAGFQPAVYFIAETGQAQVLDDGYVDELYPILNGHISMFWIYRSLKFMTDNGLYIPPRIDFTCHFDTGAPYAQLLGRILDDADATLPSLGAPRLYGAAETFHYLDDNQRLLLGQAFAGEASKDPRLRRVCFWTTPDGGDFGVDVAYPFAIEDFLPPSGN